MAEEQKPEELGALGNLVVAIISLCIILPIIGWMKGCGSSNALTDEDYAQWNATAEAQKQRLEGDICSGRLSSDFSVSYDAQEYVKQRLKAPTTAEFQRASVKHMKECMYLVTGYVDAQNAFGVPMRNGYIATMQLSSVYCKHGLSYPDVTCQDSWSLVSLEMQ
jgi:hypothetical protein